MKPLALIMVLVVCGACSSREVQPGGGALNNDFYEKQYADERMYSREDNSTNHYGPDDFIFFIDR